MASEDGESEIEQVNLILPPTTGTERTLDGLATLAEFAPALGGVVSKWATPTRGYWRDIRTS